MRIALLVLSGATACGFQLTGGQDPSDGAIADGRADALLDAGIDTPPVDGSHPGWWDAQWMHRRQITVRGSRLDGAVSDFPFLVKVAGLSDAQITGADLRFVSLDGATKYPYELDVFNAPATSFVWVKLSATTGADTTLWLYYGNAAALAESNGPAVFTNYVSVHHLGDALSDSTGNGHTAFAPALNNLPNAVDGLLGRARSFGGDDKLDLTASDAAYDFTTAMSISVWVDVQALDTAYQAIVTKGDHSWRLARANDTNGAGFGTTSGTPNQNLDGDSSIASGAWHHLAGVMDGATKRLYVDGNEDISVAYNLQLDNTQAAVTIGANTESTTGGQRFWKGLIDEVRISATPRSAVWIDAEMKTVTDNQLVLVGDEEDY